jgi:hypothetical protein
MRRLVVVMVALVALALPQVALAAKPDSPRAVFSGSDTFPAGTRCDFNYEVDYSVKLTIIETSTSEFMAGTQELVHKNLDSGYTLTEKDGFAERYDFAAGTETSHGSVWKLRSEYGELVFQAAGRGVWDLDGNTISFTPHFNPDQNLICTILASD